jgi:hypothetical protein
MLSLSVGVQTRFIDEIVFWDTTLVFQNSKVSPCGGHLGDIQVMLARSSDSPGRRKQGFEAPAIVECLHRKRCLRAGVPSISGKRVSGLIASITRTAVDLVY